MSDAPFRPPEFYRLQSGVMYPDRICALLERHFPALARLRVDARGRDSELAAVLLESHHAALRWRERRQLAAAGADTGTGQAPNPEPRRSSDWLTSRQAADLLGISVRAVTAACATSSLAGERLGGRWLISREAFEQYRAARDDRAA